MDSIKYLLIPLLLRRSACAIERRFPVISAFVPAVHAEDGARTLEDFGNAGGALTVTGDIA